MSKAPNDPLSQVFSALGKFARHKDKRIVVAALFAIVVIALVFIIAAWPSSTITQSVRGNGNAVAASGSTAQSNDNSKQQGGKK